MENKAEFCWNSIKWIELLALNLETPKSCPYPTENLMNCQNCDYYELREITPYLKRIRKIMKNC